MILARRSSMEDMMFVVTAYTGGGRGVDTEENDGC